MLNKNNSTDNKTQNFVVKTLYNTSIIVAVSILTKIVNLICNIFLARLISKEAYGIAKVYLEFSFLLLLYFPRETIRKTAQKFCPNSDNEELEDKNFKETVQLNWMLNFIFMFISYPLYASFVYFSGDALSEVKTHLIIYIIAANLELIVEPIVIYLNIKIENTNKLAAITLGNYSRVLSSCLFAYMFGFDLWAFTLSRVISSFMYVSYLIYVALFKFKLETNSLLPDFKKIINYSSELLIPNKFISSSNDIPCYLNPHLKEIFNSFVKTNILKMILTYTEKLILSFYLDLSEEDKGEYSFVVDNFAIIIRFFLEPIEESFYNLINKIKGKKIESSSVEIEVGENKEHTQTDNSFSILQVCVRFMQIFGMLLISYIFLAGKEVIVLVFTDKWGTESTVRILKCYAIYVAIISVNGIIEAYSNAIYSSEKMNTYNSFMIFNSSLLIFLSIMFTKYDVTGLILANSIMMILRISLNVYLILSEIKGKNQEGRVGIIEFAFFFKTCFIKFKSILSSIICLVLLYYAKNMEFIAKKILFVVFTTGIVFIINISLIFLIEKRSFKDLLKSRNI